MAVARLRVIFTESAFEDLEEIVAYWNERSERARGEKYACDLPAEAQRLLSDPRIAKAGRLLKKIAFPNIQELPVFKRRYRILYRLAADGDSVEVLRFWHSHREEPLS